MLLTTLTIGENEGPVLRLGHWSPARRTRTGRRWALFAVGGLLTLSACGGADGGRRDEAWFPHPTPSHSPLAVAGVEPCSTLPQAARDSTGTRAQPTVAVGDPLPPLALPCLTTGAEVNLAELGGAPMLVNIWAEWCAPCRREMPLLQQAHAEHGANVQFIGVNTKDQPDAAASFLRQAKVGYPQLVDVDAALLRSLGIPGLPVTIALSGDGRLAARHAGPLDPADLDQLLKAAQHSAQARSTQ